MDGPQGGTLTFLFTDIEGSTRLLGSLGAERFEGLLASHTGIIRDALSAHSGREVATAGDSFFAVFPNASDAVAAAAAAQRGLTAHAWPEGSPVSVRMGLDTGEATRASAAAGADYIGIPVNRAARIASAAHGGQVLVSETVRALAEESLPPGTRLRDLGERRLKDLARPQRLYQMDVEGLPSDFPPPRTLDRMPHNLPLQLTSFVGRERELAVGLRLLAATRLLTLVGPGGTGKTRLSLQVAAESAEDFPDGVFFVGLAAVSDASLVLPEVAHALGVPLTGPRAPLESLTEFVRSRRLLIVLDNLEQVVEAAPDVANMLRAGPGLKVIATSRAPLRVSGEQELPVPPLDLPSANDLADLAALPQFEAIRLFIERAVAVKPDFVVTAANARSVVEICSRLDGLPLAIELAAARTKVLPPAAMLDRLRRGLDLLTGGARDLPARQRTLRAAIAWSYDLLEPGSRRLFERFGSFAGGGSLAEIEEVCGPAAQIGVDVLDALVDLVNQSLARQEDLDGEPRFFLLETIREFAQERLQSSGEAAEIHARHARAFVALVENAAPQLSGPAQREWLDRLEREHDNVRAALNWALETGNADTGLRIAAALWWFWRVHGHLAEGRMYLTRVLDLPSASMPTSARAKALEGAAAIAFYQGDHEAAHGFGAASLAIRREIRDQPGTAGALTTLAAMAAQRGDHAAARSHLEQSLAIQREIGDRETIGIALNNLANVAHQQGDYAAARALYEESMDLQPDRPWSIAVLLGNLAIVAQDEGDLDAARSLHERSLQMKRELGDRRGAGLSLISLGNLAIAQADLVSAGRFLRESVVVWRELGDNSGIALTLAAFAGLAAARSHGEGAVRLAAAATALRDRMGAPLPASVRGRLERRLVAVQAAMTEEAVAAAASAGSNMTLEQAVTEAFEIAPAG